MQDHEQRRALLRAVNERIAEVASSTLWDGPESALEFHCECGRYGCHARVSATSEQFVRARERGGVVAPEHAHAASAARARFALGRAI